MIDITEALQQVFSPVNESAKLSPKPNSINVGDVYTVAGSGEINMLLQILENIALNESLDSEPYPYAKEEGGSAKNVTYIIKTPEGEVRVWFNAHAPLGAGVMRVMLGQKTPDKKNFKKFLGRWSKPLRVFSTMGAVLRDAIANDQYVKNASGLVLSLPNGQFTQFKSVSSKILARVLRGTKFAPADVKLDSQDWEFDYLAVVAKGKEPEQVFKAVETKANAPAGLTAKEGQKSFDPKVISDIGYKLADDVRRLSNGKNVTWDTTTGFVNCNSNNYLYITELGKTPDSSRTRIGVQSWQGGAAKTRVNHKKVEIVVDHSGAGLLELIQKTKVYKEFETAAKVVGLSEAIRTINKMWGQPAEYEQSISGGVNIKPK